MFRKAKQRRARVFQDRNESWFVRYKGMNFHFGRGDEGRRSAQSAAPIIYDQYPNVRTYHGDIEPMPRLRVRPPNPGPTPPREAAIAEQFRAVTGRIRTRATFA